MLPKYVLELALGMGKGEGQIAAKAIGPELNAAHARRSTTSVKVKKDALLIDIKADDATALRAAANGMLNSIILSKNIMEV